MRILRFLPLAVYLPSPAYFIDRLELGVQNFRLLATVMHGKATAHDLAELD